MRTKEQDMVKPDIPDVLLLHIPYFTETRIPMDRLQVHSIMLEVIEKQRRYIERLRAEVRAEREAK